MQTAYGVNSISFKGVKGTGQGQTIAIVGSYDDPNIIADAQTFSGQFGLPQFNGGGPTLQVLNEYGGTTLPVDSFIKPGTFDIEESLDVEWAHAMAPQANVILFEANSNQWPDLLTAEQTAAATPGVSVVSNSWGTSEFAGETAYDSYFETPAGHQGVTFLASTGNESVSPLYPAASPNVVAVGGTILNVDSSGDYLSESTWSEAGDGFSAYESQPAFQTGKVNGTSSTLRTAPDISMDADNPGVYVIDSYWSNYYSDDGDPGISEYLQVGGTSLSCTMMAGLVAVADQGRVLNGLTTLDGPTQTLPALYDLARDNFHDITTGIDVYLPEPGYDLATGLGTPIANNLVPALAQYQSIVTSPASVTTYQGGSYSFSGGSISVNDPAATGNSDAVSLSVANGELTLNSTAGLTFVAGANGSSSMTVTGTQASLNAALNGLVYAPTAGFNGSDCLQVSVNDANDNQTGMTRVDITVTAPPTLSAPAQIFVVENGNDVISPIGLADAAASGGSDTLSLAVTDGNLTLGSTAGLTFDTGSNGSPSMTVTGTLASLTAALNGVVYVPNPGITGPDSLQLSVADSLDHLTGSTTVLISVYSTPAILVPQAWFASQGYADSFSDGSISLSDPAASGASDSLTVSATQGTVGFPFGTPTGVTFTSGANNSSSMTINGTLANLNAALGDFDYSANTGYMGPDTIHFSLVDANNATSSNVAVPITVTGSPPGVEVYEPIGSQPLEDGFNFEFFQTFRIGDASAVGNSDTLTLSAAHGTISILDTDLITAGANGSSTITLNGPLEELYEVAIGSMWYTPDPGYIGPDTLQVSLYDAASGLSASNGLLIHVIPGAFVYAPSDVNAAENTPYTISDAFGVIDPVAAGSSDSVTFTVYPGSLTLPSTTGLTFTSGANDSSSMTVTGTLANLNAAIDDLVYSPGSNYADYGKLNVWAFDSGNEVGSRSETFINFFPGVSITAPTSVTLNVNSSYSFSGGLIDVTDQVADGIGSVESLSLSVSDGTLLLGSTNGLTWNSGADGSSSMTVCGSLTDVNAALNGLVYTPSAQFSGTDTLQISVVDPQDTLTASAAVALTINAAPSITAPATANVNENGSLTFPGTISIADAAASGTSDSLSLSVTNGTITLGSTAGITVTGGANGSSTMTVTGTLSDLNEALSGLVYAPGAGYVGSDSLRISLEDPVDNLTASGTVAITVHAPPVISAPPNASMNENSSFTFRGTISLADATASGTSDSLSLSVASGTLTLGSTAGITFTTGNNVSSSMTVTGTLANLNAALNGLVYAPRLNYSGSDSLQISLGDSIDHNSGAGSVALTINAVPSPVVTAPPAASLKENSSYTFAASAISLADSSASGTSDSLTLSASFGKLTLATTSGLTFSSGSNNSSSMTVTGTLANLNAAVSGLVYTPNSGFSGHDTLAASLTDSIDKLSGSASVAIAVNPYVTAPATANVLENGSYAFSSSGGDPISATDGGAVGTSDSLTLTVLHGKLTLGSLTGLTITSGANGSSSITVQGTLANLNAALNGLVYAPATSYTGSDTLTVTVNNASDGLSGSASVAMTVAQKKIVGGVAMAATTDAATADDSDQWAGVSAAVDVLNS
jgi:hypothetical protein